MYTAGGRVENIFKGAKFFNIPPPPTSYTFFDILPSWPKEKMKKKMVSCDDNDGDDDDDKEIENNLWRY